MDLFWYWNLTWQVVGIHQVTDIQKNPDQTKTWLEFKFYGKQVRGIADQETQVKNMSYINWKETELENQLPRYM